MECNIYPNPARQSLVVDVQNMDDSKLTISIINTAGEILYEKDYVEFMGFVKDNLDVSTLSRGFYLIRFKNGSACKLKKLILIK